MKVDLSIDYDGQVYMYIYIIMYRSGVIDVHK